MKKTLLALCFGLSSIISADITKLVTFQANFEQIIIDEQNKKITYKGNVITSAPSFAMWKYNNPINKTVYVSKDKVVIVEPELEQAIIKKIQSNLDFFSLLQQAKEIKKDLYVADYLQTKYFIKTEGLKIVSIVYTDEFENRVQILFHDQKVNKKVDFKQFTPAIPQEFDIIND
ncbi:MAG: outer-membrane lipoprotein carrier protein LolA [Epsilonproteobacteria bacterium]|nr:outer-membrane lipoprotein carrier protein LolA [Campylobacterota bacterium]